MSDKKNEGASGGSGDKKYEEVPDPELDDLLDDALQDFTKPQPIRPPSTGAPSTGAPSTGPPDLAAAMAALGVNAAVSGGGGGGGEGSTEVGMGAMWTEEFIQQATSQFENTMRALMEQQQGIQQKAAQLPPSAPAPAEASGPTPTDPPSTEGGGGGEGGGVEGAVDISSLQEQFAKFAEAAGRAANEAEGDADFTRCLADTLQQLGQNNEQLQTAPTADDLGKMFEGLGLSGGGGAGGEDAPLGGLMPLMQVMLENILSKDVLYTPIKEITDKYPDWLADHRSSLSEEEYQRYNSQYHIMSQVVELYDAETDTDSDEVKGQRFEKIMLTMQKLQELGHPPKDLVGDLGPIINFDPSGNPVLPDLSALTGGQGGGGEGGEGGEQCVVM